MAEDAAGRGAGLPVPTWGTRARRGSRRFLDTISLAGIMERSNALRMLGLLYGCIGILLLSSQWLLTPEEVHHDILVAAGSAFLFFGIFIPMQPYRTVGRGTLAAVMILGFVLMAVVNYSVIGALGPYRHIYVLLFVYIGVTQRPWTSLLFLPIALVSYVVPEVISETAVGLTLTGAIVGVPVWILTAEALSRGSAHLRTANNDLVKRNEEVQALADFQRQFVASASHELRTPLTSISGYVDLLRDEGDLNDEDQAHLAVIGRNTGRLQALVDDLLLMHRMESRSVPLDVTEVRVQDVIAPVVESFRPMCAERRITLIAPDVVETLPHVIVDKGRTEQVLTNLVGNAVKFTGRDGTIRVFVTESSSHLSVHVSDTGEGISADDLPRIFDRFFRSSTSAKRAVPGTGLGLAIAKELAELQGGDISVSSVEGEGTTFSLRLPKERRG